MHKLLRAPREYWHAVLLVLLALFSIGLDIYDIVTGQMDLSRHLPFFPYPLVLGAFAGMLVFLHKRYPLPTN